MVSSWDLVPITDHSNFTITFDSGLGIRVTAGKSNLDAIVSITKELKDGLATGALLGTAPEAGSICIIVLLPLTLKTSGRSNIFYHKPFQLRSSESYTVVHILTCPFV